MNQMHYIPGCYWKWGALSVELSPVFMSFPAQTGRIKILWRAWSQQQNQVTLKLSP